MFNSWETQRKRRARLRPTVTKSAAQREKKKKIAQHFLNPAIRWLPGNKTPDCQIWAGPDHELMENVLIFLQMS